MGALAGDEVAAGVGAVLVEGRGVCFERGFGVFVGVAILRRLGDAGSEWILSYKLRGKKR